MNDIILNNARKPHDVIIGYTGNFYLKDRLKVINSAPQEVKSFEKFRGIKANSSIIILQAREEWTRWQTWKVEPTSLATLGLLSAGSKLKEKPFH